MMLLFSKNDARVLLHHHSTRRRQYHATTTTRHLQDYYSRGNITYDEEFEQRLQRLLDPHFSLKDDTTTLWNEAEETLQWLVSSSTTQTRRTTSHHHNNNDLLDERRRLENAILLLDRLASSLPKDNSSVNQSLIDGPIFWGILPTSLLNDTLLLWKRQLLATTTTTTRESSPMNQQPTKAATTTRRRTSNSSLLPSPSQMAEKVEGYRWKCLVQPNATSFNILLHAMVQVEGVATADTYLRGLVRVAAAQQSTRLLGDDENNNNITTENSMVDIVSVSTVMQGWAAAKSSSTAPNAGAAARGC